MVKIEITKTAQDKLGKVFAESNLKLPALRVTFAGFG